MKKRTKGFTLIELIITISLIVIVLGVIYTFFFSNSKTLITNEINSDLQFEIQKIQDELLVIGTESEGVSSVLSRTGADISNQSYKDNSEMQAHEGKVEIKEISFEHNSESFVLDYEGTRLTVRKLDGSGSELVEGGYPEVLSNSVTNIYIRPIDFQMDEEGTLIDAPGVEISMILYEKKGHSNVTIPISVIVKFRNK